MRIAEALSEGYLAHPDAAVAVRELSADPLSGSGTRALAITIANGPAFEVLPDRGLDIGAAWWHGVPVGWRAPLSSPGIAPTPAGWLGRFGGGLLVTCGLDNIGAPRAGYGQHGSHHDTRAAEVAWSRLAADADQGPGVRITGVIDSVETFGRTVRMHREITARADDPAITVRDRIENAGWLPAPVAVLYHTNLGWPLVQAGTRIEVPGDRHTSIAEPHYGGWERYPAPVTELVEDVWEHRGFDGDSVTARVTSPDGLAAEISWSTRSLDRVMQWVLPVRGRWVLGIEPANAPLFGPEREADGAGIRVLEPGESFETTVRIAVSAGQ